MRSQRLQQTIAAFISSGAILVLLLFFTERSNFGQLLACFTGLFVIHIFQVKGSFFFGKPGSDLMDVPLWQTAALALRLIALFALPALSDDYFRFVWDGQLVAQGINPFLELPVAYIENAELAAKLGLRVELFEGMNSPRYYTIYPPVLQAVFGMAAMIFPDSTYGAVMVMKAFVFVAEAGSIGLMVRLLRKWELSPNLAMLYALNPFIIAELTGNLHFEAFMIFFLLLAIWLLVQGKHLLAAVPFALAICSKLLPLMLLPLLLRRLGFWKTVIFSAATLGLSVLFFLPLFSPGAMAHLLESVRLYYQSFEFNASIYYLVRWVGFQFTGYNIIGMAGKGLAVAKIVGIFLIVYFERRPDMRNLPEAMLWVFTLFFALASIVHPWYISTLVAMAVFTPFRFPMIWTLVLPLSYFTYRTTAYEENLWLVAFAYLLVACWMLREWSKQKQPAWFRGLF